MRRVSVLEVLGANAFRDCAIVFPSFGHALHWWPILIQAYKDEHGPEWINTTRTAIVSKDIHRVLRLWIPYEPDPTMPLDWPKLRRGFTMLDLYGMWGRRLP